MSRRPCPPACMSGVLARLRTQCKGILSLPSGGLRGVLGCAVVKGRARWGAQCEDPGSRHPTCLGRADKGPSHLPALPLACPRRFSRARVTHQAGAGPRLHSAGPGADRRGALVLELCQPGQVQERPATREQPPLPYLSTRWEGREHEVVAPLRQCPPAQPSIEHKPTVCSLHPPNTRFAGHCHCHPVSN